MNDEAPDRRTRRIADNEGRFREVNDRLGRELEGLVGEEESIEFVCECGDLDCRERLVLRRAEYEQVRANPRTFAVIPGHEIPDVEDIVERFERYLVVEKPLAVHDRVTRSDPRSEG